MTPAVAVIAIARREVAAAARSGMCATRMSNGTATIPPPTPKNAEKPPAASPMATRRTGVSYECDQSRRHRRASRPRLVGGCVVRGGGPAEQGLLVLPWASRPAAVPVADVWWRLDTAGESTRDALRSCPAQGVLRRRFGPLATSRLRGGEGAARGARDWRTRARARHPRDRTGRGLSRVGDARRLRGVDSVELAAQA